MIESKNLNHANITVVFERLDTDLIKRDLVRKAFGKDSVMTEFPDLLILATPGTDKQAKFNGRKLSINSPVEKIEDAFIFLGQACHNLLKATDELKTVAYGYNLKGSANKSGLCVKEQILKVCFSGGVTLSQAIGAKVISVVPKFSFNKHGALFNVTLMHSENEKEMEIIQFHCNIHYSDAVPPTTGDMITEQLILYNGYFFEILEMILEV